MQSLFPLMQRLARLDHPEVREIVPSHHCVVRFRQRRPLRERGGEAVAAALIEALEAADVTPLAAGLGGQRPPAPSCGR